MKTTKMSAMFVAAALMCPAFTFAEDEQGKSAADRGAAAQRAADQAGSSAQGTADRAGAAASDAANAAGDAAQTAAARAGSQSQMSEEQKFVRAAASGGMMEIEAARLAQQRAQRQEVKDFAQQMIQDHTQANQRLMQIAQSKQIQVPREMKASHRAQLQELQELQGEDFENAYVIHNVGDHVKMVLKFQKSQQKLQDAELKAFAAQTLPKIQQHLQHAQQLAGWDSAQAAGARLSGSDDASSGSTTPAAGDRQTGGQRSGSSSGTDAGSSSGQTGTGTSGAASDQQNR